jgi:hypothetical protein
MRLVDYEEKECFPCNSDAGCVDVFFVARFFFWG